MRTGRLATVRSLWPRPRLLLALAVWPVLLGLLWWSGSSPSATAPLLVGAALALSLTLVTYLPAGCQSPAQSVGSPCGIVGLVLSVLGAAAISDGASGPGLGYGVAFVLAGLAHRVVTGGACGSLPR